MPVPRLLTKSDEHRDSGNNLPKSQSASSEKVQSASTQKKRPEITPKPYNQSRKPVLSPEGSAYSSPSEQKFSLSGLGNFLLHEQPLHAAELTVFLAVPGGKETVFLFDHHAAEDFLVSASEGGNFVVSWSLVPRL